MLKLTTIIFSLVFTCSVYAQEKRHKIKNFSQAKKVLKKYIYPTGKTFYCGCDFSFKDKSLDTSKCGYEKKGNYKGFIDMEHASSAHSWGQYFKEWREGDPKCIKNKYVKIKPIKRKSCYGKVKRKEKPFCFIKKQVAYKGRDCARKNPKFVEMESDLHNLFPALPELNRRRKNFTFTEISGEVREFGKCDFEIKDRKAEPPTVPIERRGDIARAHFYMEHRYNIKVISNKQKKMYEIWDKQDKVTSSECLENELKTRHQGNDNPFITKHCKK